MDKKHKFLLSNHIVLCFLSVVMILFFCSGFIVGNENITGFQLLTFPNGDLVATTLSVAVVFFLVGLTINLIISFCLFLSDFEIIEEPKTLDMLEKLLVIMTTIILNLSFVILICLKLKTSQLNRGESSLNQLGIGGVINFVFSIVIFLQSIALKFADKINFDKNK